MFHNLCLLVSDETYIDIPLEWLEPNLFFQARKAASFDELYSFLEANHQALLTRQSSASPKEIVAELLNELIDTIDNEKTFEYSFITNLPKRPVESLGQTPSRASGSRQ